MNFKKYIDIKNGLTGISGAFCAYGSFGIIDGRNDGLEGYTETENGYKADYDAFSVDTSFEVHENDICIRRDTLTAKTDLTLNKFASRFLLEGGNYEVYTQYSNWQHESLGAWQDLITGIELSNLGIRTTDGAAPMAVIKNKGTGRMLVLHLLPNAAWKIKIAKLPVGARADGVLIELGINETGFNLKCKAGEVIEMPEIIFYNTMNSIDFDAWKLHALFNKLYPRKNLPVAFNTWMYTFDKIFVKDIFKQVDTAKELGMEMFLIDAGWFGVTEDWGENIGAWTENLEGGFRGRLSEVSDYIRSQGLTFGLWLEPERALDNVPIAKEHPEYFLKGSKPHMFLDFANPDARKYMFDTISNLVDKYHIGFMKFDFNAPLAYDETGSSFYRYFEGQRQLMRDLKTKYPELYITNCASGGYRMDLAQQKVFDSVWISDNHGPVDGLRIFKDTALRMPPSNMEKWDTRKYADGFLKYGHFEKTQLPISCVGAQWSEGVIVDESYTHGYISGGFMGFSANISEYPDEEKVRLKSLIAEHKENRDFYKNAVMRILYDTSDVLVLQYSDLKLKYNVIQVFFNKILQSQATFFPVLNSGKKYTQNGETKSADEIMSDGVTVTAADYSCVTLEFCEV
ncbi:MAG: alpha-galactosidase [Clostridia bacterium]|nr:alpha-galactosidase [Clostridia bacterium]